MDIRIPSNILLPFPILPAPPLVEIPGGEWELVRNSLPAVANRYFQKSFRPLDRSNWVLRNRKTKTVWMSTSPMERESQSHHVFAAHGRVLVGGLGLGAVLWSLLEKSSVEEVVVVERDEKVIALMTSVWLKSKPWARHISGPRFHLVQGDALDPSGWPEFTRSRPFDFGIIDIWPSIGDMELRPDMKRMATALPQVKEWAAWGLELDFVSWKIEQNLRAFENPPSLWREYSDSIGVPLLGREWPWMAELASAAAMVQSLRL